MSGLIERLRDWVSPPAVPPGPAPDPAAAEVAPGRRGREPTPAERQLAEAVAQKLLHGWLQNRHQTLMPLSVNLARLAPDERAHVARFAAVAASAGTDARAPARVSAWLAAAGADPETLAIYDAALAAPPALGRAIGDMSVPERAGLAYVLALVAAREGEAGDAGHAFADYVAKRLTLPSAAMRSAERRYRR